MMSTQTAKLSVVMLILQVANCYYMKTSLLGVANLYDAGGLCRLWSRAQGENW